MGKAEMLRSFQDGWSCQAIKSGAVVARADRTQMTVAIQNLFPLHDVLRGV
jgi:hypothetical protein